MYTLWGRKRFLLPVTYFPTNLVYPFTLRVTGIKSARLSIYIALPKQTVDIVELCSIYIYIKVLPRSQCY